MRERQRHREMERERGGIVTETQRDGERAGDSERETETQRDGEREGG